MYRFLWLLPDYTKEIRASVGFRIVSEGDDFSLLTPVLHRKTINCHRASVVCDDGYVERTFVLLVLLLFAGFAFLDGPLLLDSFSISELIAQHPLLNRCRN